MLKKKTTKLTGVILGTLMAFTSFAPSFMTEKVYALTEDHIGARSYLSIYKPEESKVKVFEAINFEGFDGEGGPNRILDFSKSHILDWDQVSFTEYREKDSKTPYGYNDKGIDYSEPMTYDLLVDGIVVDTFSLEANENYPVENTITIPFSEIGLVGSELSIRQHEREGFTEPEIVSDSLLAEVPSFDQGNVGPNFHKLESPKRSVAFGYQSSPLNIAPNSMELQEKQFGIELMVEALTQWDTLEIKVPGLVFKESKDSRYTTLGDSITFIMDPEMITYESDLGLYMFKNVFEYIYPEIESIDESAIKYLENYSSLEMTVQAFKDGVEVPNIYEQPIITTADVRVDYLTNIYEFDVRNHVEFSHGSIQVVKVDEISNEDAKRQLKAERLLFPGRFGIGLEDVSQTKERRFLGNTFYYLNTLESMLEEYTLSPVANSTFELRSQQGVLIDSATTNEQGFLDFLNVPVGEYQVIDTSTGEVYQTEIVGGISGEKREELYNLFSNPTEDMLDDLLNTEIPHYSPAIIASPNLNSEANSNITTEEVSYTRQIPYEVETLYDEELPFGEEVVLVEGVFGERLITEKITYTDGLETSRELLKDEIVKHPVNMVIKKGLSQAPQIKYSHGGSLIHKEDLKINIYDIISSPYHHTMIKNENFDLRNSSVLEGIDPMDWDYNKGHSLLPYRTKDGSYYGYNNILDEDYLETTFDYKLLADGVEIMSFTIDENLPLDLDMDPNGEYKKYKELTIPKEYRDSELVLIQEEKVNFMEPGIIIKGSYYLNSFGEVIWVDFGGEYKFRYKSEPLNSDIIETQSNIKYSASITFEGFTEKFDSIKINFFGTTSPKSINGSRYRLEGSDVIIDGFSDDMFYYNEENGLWYLDYEESNVNIVLESIDNSLNEFGIEYEGVYYKDDTIIHSEKGFLSHTDFYDFIDVEVRREIEYTHGSVGVLKIETPQHIEDVEYELWRLTRGVHPFRWGNTYEPGTKREDGGWFGFGSFEKDSLANFYLNPILRYLNTKKGIWESQMATLVEGATFELRTLDGTLIDTKTTDETGFVSFVNIPVGKYQIIETTENPVYEIESEPRIIEVVGGVSGETRSQIMREIKGSEKTGKQRYSQDNNTYFPVEILYSDRIPMVSFEDETTILVVEAPEIIIEDNNLFIGDNSVVPGENGERTIIERITYTDGVETSREVISDEITKEPTPTIITKGTKPLPVITTDNEITIIEIPSEIVIVEDDKLFIGVEINNPGENGERTIIERITYTDGVETSREVISDEITKEPTPTIITKGTKPLPVITTEEILIETEIGFETSIIKDPNLLVNEEVVSQEGIPGKLSTLIKITYTDGVETSREEMIQERVDPVNRVILVGTKEAETLPKAGENGLTVVIYSTALLLILMGVYLLKKANEEREGEAI